MHRHIFCAPADCAKAVEVLRRATKAATATNFETRAIMPTDRELIPRLWQIIAWGGEARKQRPAMIDEAPEDFADARQKPRARQSTGSLAVRDFRLLEVVNPS